MKTLLSSQDFRNSYEKFYSRIRNYLWPLSTLKILADVETDIYAAFIDYKALDLHLNRLYPFIKEQVEEDEFVSKTYNDLRQMLDDVLADPNADSNRYLNLNRVQEIDPELNKILVTDKEDEKDEDNKEYRSESLK